MIDIIIWISVGMFLLLPYYLRIYILDLKKTRIHICFWLCMHLVSSIMYYILCGQKYSVATVILIGYAVYYFFSYIFCVRGEKNSIESSTIACIVKSNFFEIFKKIILAIGGIVLILDGVLVWGNAQNLEMIDKIYLFGIITISYMQCYMYLWEYRKLYCD